MEIAFVKEANFARKKPLPEGYRQIVFICDALEMVVIIKNVVADWAIEVAVEGETKFCMATSPDGTQGWVERWRARRAPRRVALSQGQVGLSIADAVEALRAEVTEGDPEQPLLPEEQLVEVDPESVQRIEHHYGADIAFVFKGHGQSMRSLSDPEWPMNGYQDRKGFYALFHRPDGTFLLEACMVWGRGGGMRRWQAEGGAAPDAMPDAIVRQLLKKRTYDAELFHRLDAERPPREAPGDNGVAPQARATGS